MSNSHIFCCFLKTPIMSWGNRQQRPAPRSSTSVSSTGGSEWRDGKASCSTQQKYHLLLWEVCQRRASTWGHLYSHNFDMYLMVMVGLLLIASAGDILGFLRAFIFNSSVIAPGPSWFPLKLTASLQISCVALDRQRRARRLLLSDQGCLQAHQHFQAFFPPVIFAWTVSGSVKNNKWRAYTF